SMTVLERLNAAGLESSNAWNNAGTGHSALCELNYAPQAADGTVSAKKALNINEQFQVTRQLWSSLVENGTLESPDTFINPVPHISMVLGEDHADYLRARYDAFNTHKLFERIEFTENRDQIAEWAPLTMHGRGAGRVAATFAPEGTDVDFGALTNQLLTHLT
ncbi:malate:quinone oxidoreductase, partial [Streptomyces sp. tea 10]|nr:malate:quinone oxidoreductase [Streptomyces sp. tea 10]